jgi:hypothetical protein
MVMQTRFTQDTGFGSVLPTEERLWALNTMEEILEAFGAINADYERHSRAARGVTTRYFLWREVPIAGRGCCGNRL